MANDLEPLYALIRRFEGCRLTPYLCPAGVWTCGWGSTGPDVYPGVPWTQAYADQRMLEDAHQCVVQTKQLCPGLERDALCAIADFVYNLGAGRLRSSTLRRVINAGDMVAAQAQLMKWVYGNGRVLPGLTRRRAVEALLIAQARKQ